MDNRRTDLARKGRGGEEEGGVGGGGEIGREENGGRAEGNSCIGG